MHVGAHRVGHPCDISEQGIQKQPANTRPSMPRRDTDTQLRQRHASRIRAQGWTAVIGPHCTHGNTVVILGEDWHRSARRKQFQHLIVAWIRQRPVLDHARVTRHFDDERVIAGVGCTQNHA